MAYLLLILLSSLRSQGPAMDPTLAGRRPLFFGVELLEWSVDEHKQRAILLIDCPDRKGLVASISDFLYTHGANILHADQHQDRDAGLFFMRVEWALDAFDLKRFEDEFAPLATGMNMHWQIHILATRPRVAILVSQHLHCLADLLYRHSSGELDCEIPLVISNHETGRELARFHSVEFFHTPVGPSTEAEQLRLLASARIDLVVLARYMRILSADFVARYPAKIINVHHSFLPAFVGARPYHAAFERGVKIIGATSHYVTESLDQGPIIEQDVIRVSHRDQVEDLVRKGRDMEKLVLSRAVAWHLERRILSYANKTVIFD